MRRALPPLVALALLLLPSAAALAAEEPARYLRIGERPDGTIVVERLTASQLDHETVCGGIAPVVSSCGGVHAPYTEGIAHGFIVDCMLYEFPSPYLNAWSCFTGQLTSTLNGQRTFRCDYLAGVTFFTFNPSCVGLGEWPQPGQPIEQQCQAQTWALVVPGGPAAGWWRCELQHY